MSAKVEKRFILLLAVGVRTPCRGLPNVSTRLTFLAAFSSRLGSWTGFFSSVWSYVPTKIDWAFEWCDAAGGCCCESDGPMLSDFICGEEFWRCKVRFWVNMASEEPFFIGDLRGLYLLPTWPGEFVRFEKRLDFCLFRLIMFCRYNSSCSNSSIEFAPLSISWMFEFSMRFGVRKVSI